MKTLINSLGCGVLWLGLLGCDGPSSTAIIEAPTAQPSGEQMQRFGNIAVHYHALLSDQLSPEVAKQYQIRRASELAMINVVVNQVDATGNETTTPAQIEIKAHNLTGQVKSLSLKRVQSGDVIYHIGTVPVSHRETLVFDLSIQPEQRSEQPLTLSFSQQFYTQ